MDARLPVRRLKESRASTRYGVSLFERSLLISRRSVLLSGEVAINLNQCPVVTAGRPGQTQNRGHSHSGSDRGKQANSASLSDLIVRALSSKLFSIQ